MATFQFELVSPERLLFSAEAEQVVVPGTEGDFGVLANHAPVMSTIRPGVLSVETGSERKEYVLLGGFAEVSPERLTVLAEKAYERDAVDKDDLAQQVQNAREDVADAKDDETRAKAQEQLDQLEQLQALV